MTRATATALGSLFALAACGGGVRPEASAPRSQTVVEIPQVDQEQTDRNQKDDLPPPASHREARVESQESPEKPEPYPEDSPWAQPPPPVGGVVGTGGPDCDRAADCCLKFVYKNGPDPSLLSMCAGVRQASSSTCGYLLTSFRQIAPQAGVQCN